MKLVPTPKSVETIIAEMELNQLDIYEIQQRMHRDLEYLHKFMDMPNAFETYFLKHAQEYRKENGQIQT